MEEPLNRSQCSMGSFGDSFLLQCTAALRRFLEQSAHFIDPAFAGLDDYRGQGKTKNSLKMNPQTPDSLEPGVWGLKHCNTLT